MINKKYCMSSYLAFRYIEKDNIDFYEGLSHSNIVPIPDEKKTLVKTEDEIGYEIKKCLDKYKDKKLGILLSGGMDSAICASYMEGCDAYTFRFINGDFQREELERAKYYADYYGLNLHYVDIDWNTVEIYVDQVMKAKGSPVHSIEPQILQAALQAKKDGIEMQFGSIRVILGKSVTTEKVAQITPILAKLEGKEGTLNLEHFEDESSVIAFTEDIPEDTDTAGEEYTAGSVSGSYY